MLDDEVVDTGGSTGDTVKHPETVALEITLRPKGEV